MKLKVRIPAQLKDKADDIRSFFKTLISGPGQPIEKAVKNQDDNEVEKPICPAEQLITEEMERALVIPVIESMKRKVFKLAGILDLFDKSPDDPKHKALYKSFRKTYAQELKDDYLAEIDPKEVSEADAEKIAEAMKLVSHVYRPETFRIKVRNLGNKLGRWDEVNETMYLAPGIFNEKFMLTTEKTVNLGQKVLIHEIAHILDHDRKISNGKDWRDISGWCHAHGWSKKQGQGKIRARYNQNGIWKRGKWYHGKQAAFINNYASRNPKEDWAESFAYALLGAGEMFKLQGAEKKLEFVQRIIKSKSG